MKGLAQSISLYTSRAAEKLRAQQSYAGSITVFIQTSPFRDQDPQYGPSRTVALSTATDDTTTLVGIAMLVLGEIYERGYKYVKAGIMLGELVPAAGVQSDMFSDMQPKAKSANLMNVLDSVNRKMGKNTLVTGSQGFAQPWAIKQEKKSPNYTTRWDEILKVD
jgi:DNA polymerase V